jgi:sugar-specific transcriptional regulator TrmB
MIETLQEIGLSHRESKCYIALLELGSTKIGPLCKKTEIPSSKIYEILEKLIKKGLVAYTLKDNIKYFQASDPKNIINHLEDKKKMVEQIIPQLLLKQQFSKKQSVELFEGEKAILRLFTNRIADAKPKELYVEFAMSENNKTEQINRHFRTLTLKKKEKGLDVRILKNIKDYKREKHTKVKLRYTQFNLPQGISIFRDSVIITSWGETPTAIKIESELYAKQYKEFFLELWVGAKK